jgi:site-specific DNA-cytosine methylase
LGLRGEFLKGGRHLPVTWWQGSRRIDVDAPSFTIGTRNNADWICPVGGQAWRPRLAELALLQGLPAGMTFAGDATAQHRQMGNAFPPQVAQAVGQAIARVLARSGNGTKAVCA